MQAHNTKNELYQGLQVQSSYLTSARNTRKWVILELEEKEKMNVMKKIEEKVYHKNLLYINNISP